MKVLFVIPSRDSITGASIAMINIILGLLNKGIEAYVVASDPPPEYRPFLDELAKNNAKLFFISSKERGWIYWKKLTNKAMLVINENDIKIIHLHLPKLVYFLGKKVKNQRRKLIMTLEGDPISEVKELGFFTKFRTKILWKRCIKYADIICPCSEWLTTYLQKRDKISNIVTVHNPINLTQFSSSTSGIRNVLGISQDEFVVMTAARLVPIKGVDILIRGFADFVNNTNARAKLLILGTGQLQNKLEDLSKKLEIKDKIIFLGFRNNPQDYLSECDVFVMSSTYEPFGMPAAEAGLLGIPTIVSKAGGLTEIVIHEKTGYQFEIGDYKQLSSYLEQLFKNNEYRRKLGQNAIAHIRANFTPDIIANKIIQIYSELTKAKRSKAIDIN